MQRHVIIGNGVAGISAAETIRALDPHASITIIAREEHPPYSRPMISLVLEGTLKPERLSMRPGDYYDRMNIEALTGAQVIGIDLGKRQVVTDRGREIAFDRLLIASGADPRPIKTEGSGLKNVFFMRTQTHVRGMIEALPEVREALVLGGGLVGFKAAHGLLRRGVKVTMLISSGHPLSMQVDEVAGRMILEELLAQGLEIRVGTEVSAFHGNGSVREAVLSDGSTLPCQMAVVGKGVTPAVSFVPPGGIKIDQGILVDRHMQTSAPGVYAAGDVAEAVDCVRGRPWVNAVWPVAVEQGRLAGVNMAGRAVPYRGSMGRNVIRVFGLDVLTGGLVNPPEDGDCRILTRHNPAAGTYRKLVLQDKCLVGLAMVGQIEQGGILLSLIQRRETLTVKPETLLEPSFNFGRLLP